MCKLIVDPPKIWCDISSIVPWQPIQFSTKHVDLDFHFVREKVFVKLKYEIIRRINYLKFDFLCIINVTGFLGLLIVVYWLIEIHHQVDLIIVRL